MCERLGTVQTVTIGAASAACTNPFGDQTREIRVICTANAHVVIAGTPVATTGDTYMALGREEEFRVNPGEKIAVIQNSAGGVLYVTELTK